MRLGVKLSGKSLHDVFGRVVRRRREKLGLSQEELGYKAGLHRTYVSLLERGRRNPSLNVVAALARGLGTSTVALMGDLEAEKRGK